MNTPIVRGLPMLTLEKLPALPSGFKVIQWSSALPVVVEHDTDAEQFLAFDQPPRLVPVIRRIGNETHCDFNRAIALA